jgi:hypothetical protein
VFEGGIDRFEPPDVLKKYKDTKTGFLIGHGEVLPNKKNIVSLSKSKDLYDISVPHISMVWRKNEQRMVSEMNKMIELIINAGNGILRISFTGIIFPFPALIISSIILFISETILCSFLRQTIEMCGTEISYKSLLFDSETMFFLYGSTSP